MVQQAPTSIDLAIPTKSDQKPRLDNSD